MCSRAVCEFAACPRRLSFYFFDKNGWRHVRSHTECPGNELADALADRGKDASPKNAVGWQHEETTRYAKEWMRQWRRGHSPDGGEASGEREGGQANEVVGDRCGVG